MSVRDADRSKPYIPLAGLANDGYSNDDEATATCYCGAVQLAFPPSGPGLVNTFICHCTDCRKITASMFASNFTVRTSHLRHIRGQTTLKQFSQQTTTTSGQHMTNSFCGTCGTLMYRAGEAFPGLLFLRLGTVDDVLLVEGKLKPQVEQFVKDRVGWLGEVGGEGVERSEGMGM
ncbi:hypothetical protein T440DRAFT_533334 [Plenodomus tracheiphilus IPT5]|uniref:CENP-V/GFA domain-containing protein n=1 Tax=Plenodomus tracheiphilus IPT5 TaxID=1408161 RepID=A0A6A7B2Q0_9PLEO|nr:hypothetical protein T440DRAFT_533334 [Plenodomus tracheiphilus IPT5]